jgi:uncharacterized protein YkwD
MQKPQIRHPHRGPGARLCALGVGSILALAAAAGSSAARPMDPIFAVQTLREGGCGGILPPARRLEQDALLDRVARDWATGRTLGAATESSGYQSEKVAGLHITGSDSAMLQQLRRSSCLTVTNRDMRDVGMYRRGTDTWLVLGYKYVVPSSQEAPRLAARTLELVNEARSQPRRCGSRAFAPAPPLTLDHTLDSVAYGHATDMAEHNYFEHEDLAGHTPADRVRAVGYREKLVGENIAFGPRTADEVVQGWLDSPGHCENIMDPRFAQMGIAYAAGHAKRGLFWVQLFAQPKA